MSRDWLGSATGVAALAVSLGTLYWNVLRQVDDLRVSFVGSPDLRVENSVPPHFAAKADHNLVFINSGSQSAAVTDVHFLIQQPLAPGQKPLRCDEFSSDRMAYVFDPLVLKPGEIGNRRVHLMDMPRQREAKDGEQLFSLTAENLRRKEFYALACVAFFVVAPDSSTRSIVVPLYRVEFDRDDITHLAPLPTFLNNSKEPIVLLQQWSTILKGWTSSIFR